jgi:hypothetical protein
MVKDFSESRPAPLATLSAHDHARLNQYRDRPSALVDGLELGEIKSKFEER